MRLPLTTLALLSAPLASAQTWSRTVPSGANGWIQEARELPNGEIVALHRTRFTTTNLLRLDASGTVLSARNLHHTAAGIWPLSSGQLAICGGFDFDCNAWVTALDASDATLWSRETTSSYLTYAFLESVRETADGGLFAVGYTILDDCDREALAYKFDANGTLLWEFHFGDASNYFYGTDGVELADGSFRLFGATTFHHLAMIELDAAGQFVSTISWDTTTSLHFPQTHVDLASDGNILVVPGPWSFDKAFLVMKIAPDGTTLWEREFSPVDRGFNGAMDVVATSDGGGVVVGNTLSNGAVSDIVLMRFDNSGEVVWQTLYGGPDWDAAFGLSAMADGGFLVSGQTRNETTGVLEGLLLRVDAVGQIAGCPASPAWLAPTKVTQPTGVPTGGPDIFGSPFADGAAAQPTSPPTSSAICLQAGVGTSYCSPAVPNSSGASAVAWVIGSETLASNLLFVAATDLPPNQFGYFLTGQGSTVVQPPGAQGNLCLDGSTIFRYAADVQSSGPLGVFGQPVDVNQVPGHGAIQAGETWNFQAWFRDHNPAATSNFTDAVSVVFS